MDSRLTYWKAILGVIIASYNTLFHPTRRS